MWISADWRSIAATASESEALGFRLNEIVPGEGGQGHHLLDLGAHRLPGGG